MASDTEFRAWALAKARELAQSLGGACDCCEDGEVEVDDIGEEKIIAALHAAQRFDVTN